MRRAGARVRGSRRHGPSHNRCIAATRPRSRRSLPAFTQARRVLAVAAWFVPRENPASAVYGLLAIGAVLAAESAGTETYGVTFLSAVISACLYWLLHAYSTLLGRRLKGQARVDTTGLGSALSHDAPLLRGAAIPVMALVLCWALGASQPTGLYIALWTCVGALVAFEFLAAVRSRATVGEFVLQLAIGVTMGLLVLVLRVVLHH